MDLGPARVGGTDFGDCRDHRCLTAEDIAEGIYGTLVVSWFGLIITLILSMLIRGVSVTYFEMTMPQQETALAAKEGRASAAAAQVSNDDYQKVVAVLAELGFASVVDSMLEDINSADTGGDGQPG